MTDFLKFKAVKEKLTTFLDSDAWRTVNRNLAVNEVGSQTLTMNNYLIDTYSDVFEGRRCLFGDYRIELDPTVTPVKQ